MDTHKNAQFSVLRAPEPTSHGCFYLTPRKIASQQQKQQDGFSWLLWLQHAISWERERIWERARSGDKIENPVLTQLLPRFASDGVSSVTRSTIVAVVVVVVLAAFPWTGLAEGTRGLPNRRRRRQHTWIFHPDEKTGLASEFDMHHSPTSSRAEKSHAIFHFFRTKKKPK